MRARIAILAVLGIVTLSGCGWTQFRGDSRHTGSNPFERTISAANVALLTPAWTNSNQNLLAQQVVVRAGRAFVSASLNFYAIDTATGSVAWSIPRTKGVFGPGTTDGGGGAAGRIFAAERWTISTGRFSGESSGLLHILDATDGSQLDAVPLGGGAPVFSSTWRYQAINADIFPTNTIPSYIHRVDATSGSEAFTVDFVQSSVADVASDGDHVFAVVGNFTSLRSIPPRGCGAATCSSLWQSAPGDIFNAVTISGPTVFARTETRVEAFPVDGCGASQCAPLWTTPDPPLGYPIDIAVSGDRLYLTRGAKLEVYAAAGCGIAICPPLWTATTTGTPTAPSVANGVVYAGSSDGTLFAWNAAGCGAATCAPLLAQSQGGAVGPVSIDQGSLYFTVGGALRRLVIPGPA